MSEIWGSSCDLVVMEERDVSRKTPALLFHTNGVDQRLFIEREP